MDEVLLLFSLVGPFLVWPIEYYLPYSFIVEELFKLLLVYFFAKKTAKPFVMSGIVFALTETVFYTFNVNAFGSLSIMPVRFISTSILHSTTFAIIYYANKIDRKLIVIGFFIAVLIHFLYNRLIPTY